MQLVTPSIFVSGIKCQIGQTTNSIQFSFDKFSRPDLTQVIFKFTNFRNPWSASTIESIRIDSYSSSDCTGEAESSV